MSSATALYFSFSVRKTTSGFSSAQHGLVGGDDDDFELVDLFEFGGFGFGGAGHAAEFLIEAEVVLEGDGGERLIFLADADAFLGLDGLVEAVGPAAAGHEAAGESVDDDDFAVFDDVLDIALVEGVGLDGGLDVVLELPVFGVGDNLAGLSLNASADRYQNFYQDPLTNSYSDQIKIFHLPMVEVNGLERRVFSSPFVWAVDSSASGLQRSEPGFVTANLVGRLDIHPRLALPLRWKGWNLRPEIAVQDTLYTQQVTVSAANPLGAASGNELNRSDLEMSIELRPPAMEKVFDHEIFGRRLKHVIEPIFTYNYATGVNNFQHVIRFDQVDILSNTSEVQYDVIQRIYGRRRSTHHEAGSKLQHQPLRPDG